MSEGSQILTEWEVFVIMGVHWTIAIISYYTGTSEIVQPIKSVEENIEDGKEMKIRDLTMYL